jgi:hypothetical protein
VKWFPNIRLLVVGIRILRTLDDLADSHRILARIAQSTWDENHRVRKPQDGPYKKVVVGAFDQTAANEAWHKQQVAAGLEDDEGNPL